MPTPVEIIFAYKAQLDQRDALQAGAEQVVSCYGRLYQQIAQHVGEFAALCAQHGKAELLEQLPPEVRSAVLAGEQAMRDTYAACSPFPFPELPEHPVPEPEAAE